MKTEQGYIDIGEVVCIVTGDPRYVALSHKYIGKTGIVNQVYGSVPPFHYQVVLDDGRIIMARGDELKTT